MDNSHKNENDNSVLFLNLYDLLSNVEQYLSIQWKSMGSKQLFMDKPTHFFKISFFEVSKNLRANKWSECSFLCELFF